MHQTQVWAPSNQPGVLQMNNNGDVPRIELKVIRFDPLAPVKTTALLLPVEWKMCHFISYDEYL